MEDRIPLYKLKLVRERWAMMTERYAHLSPDVRKDAVRLLDRCVPQVHVNGTSMGMGAGSK